MRMLMKVKIPTARGLVAGRSGPADRTRAEFPRSAGWRLGSASSRPSSWKRGRKSGSVGDGGQTTGLPLKRPWRIGSELADQPPAS